jgi:hypothetical protein
VAALGYGCGNDNKKGADRLGLTLSMAEISAGTRLGPVEFLRTGQFWQNELTRARDSVLHCRTRNAGLLPELKMRRSGEGEQLASHSARGDINEGL